MVRGAHLERGAASPGAQYGPLQAGAHSYLDGSRAINREAEEAERRPAERAAICAAVVDDADRGAEDWGGSGTLGGYFYCKTVFNRSVEIDVGFRRTYRNQ